MREIYFGNETMQAAIDFGITNIDVIYRQAGDFHRLRIAAQRQPLEEQFGALRPRLEQAGACLERAAVTGGQYRSLPEQVGHTRLVKINEVDAVGRGGLRLAGLEQALVVSAGSGTAMVAARGQTATHVTGSAVGGGTLQGLGRLLLGTADALEIDRLAQQGDANQADLTLVEAVGGSVGRLPRDANAVNFGRVAREALNLAPADRAAALVRLVGQVIAVVAINAARAEGLAVIVVTGHLVDLLSVRRVLNEVSGYYQADIRVPEQPGFGTALGALLCLEEAAEGQPGL
jgi:type II pantothenate kinase